MRTTSRSGRRSSRIGSAIASAAALALCTAGTAFAQTPAISGQRASIQLTVENPKLQPASYSLQIFEDGSGTYTETLSSAASSDTVSSDQDPGSATQIERPVRISEPLLTHLFQTVQPGPFFTAGCEPVSGRIAFTGKKTLAYNGPGGAGSCTFNYSREKSMNEIAEQLSAIAYTLQEGLRLNREHRYDRLGLVDELESLQDAAHNKQALELENIRPELLSIAEDDAVMNLARARARALLAEPEPTSLR